jgi:LCP family protein required for cell wall assembly
MTTTPEAPELSQAASERILRTVHREMAMSASALVRPHRARRVLVGSLALASVASLIVGGYVAYHVRSIRRVDIRVSPTTNPDVSNSAASTGSVATTTPTTETRARNFLIVGSDSRVCIDPSSPNAGAFLGQSPTGENTDTIMLVRVEPSAPSAVVSFPRDLWVKVPGSDRSARINSLQTSNDPTTLVRAIEDNFLLHVDHYVEIDFCGFKAMVDAVGGVKVPFRFPALDRQTGLNVDSGCHTFMGEEALAYVRSRYFEWYDGAVWQSDRDSDLSRISRQQDFVKRLLQTALDRGASNPVVAKQLLDAVASHLVLDKDLSISDLVRLASTLRSDDPERLRSYRVEGVFDQDGAVIVADRESETNKAILSVFRGEAQLSAGAPATGEASRTPTVDAPENPVGVVPPADPTCR